MAKQLPQQQPLPMAISKEKNRNSAPLFQKKRGNNPGSNSDLKSGEGGKKEDSMLVVQYLGSSDSGLPGRRKEEERK